MANSEPWELPEQLRPQQSRFDVDLTAIYRSVVLVHTEASADGYTAPFLGTERLGSGVVIRSAERKRIIRRSELFPVGVNGMAFWGNSVDGSIAISGR